MLANSIIFAEKAKQEKKNKSEGNFFFHNIHICILKIFPFNSAPEESAAQATSVWSATSILKQKANAKNLILARKQNLSMGYSKGQKTLRSYDKCAPPPKKTKAEPLEPINEVENDNLNVVQILESDDEVVALEKPKIDRDYYVYRVKFKHKT